MFHISKPTFVVIVSTSFRRIRTEKIFKLNNPDPPFLAFWDFLAFLLLQFSLLVLGAVLISFPRIMGGYIA